MSPAGPVVRSERWAIGTTLALIGLTVSVVWIAPPPRVTVAGLPAALVGALVGPLVYRRYRHAMLHPAAGEPTEARFVRATRSALTGTAGAALIGLVGWWLSAEWMALLGVATHVLIAGAIWPNAQRLEAFAQAGQAS